MLREEGTGWRHLEEKGDFRVIGERKSREHVLCHPPPFIFTVCLFVNVNLKTILYSLAKS